MLVGCAKEEKTVKRAVFAWEGVEEADEQLLENYRIDTIFMLKDGTILNVSNDVAVSQN